LKQQDLYLDDEGGKEDDEEPDNEKQTKKKRRTGLAQKQDLSSELQEFLGFQPDCS
jgi:hypothetical protein